MLSFESTGPSRTSLTIHLLAVHLSERKDYVYRNA